VTKERITKSEISMRTWHAWMRAAPQGTFVVIPEISHSDNSYIITKRLQAHVPIRTCACSQSKDHAESFRSRKTGETQGKVI
jgi:uncharacterized protein YlaI